jgi:hypothetical protein
MNAMKIRFMVLPHIPTAAGIVTPLDEPGCPNRHDEQHRDRAEG